VPLHEGGFAQRSFGHLFGPPTVVETEIQQEGWDVMCGSIAIVEIPYSAEELAQLKEEGLIEEDFEPPTTLVELYFDKEAKEGLTSVDCNDPGLRMSERRFVNFLIFFSCSSSKLLYILQVRYH
jgi:hypothetical protein